MFAPNPSLHPLLPSSLRDSERRKEGRTGPGSFYGIAIKYTRAEGMHSILHIISVGSPSQAGPLFCRDIFFPGSLHARD